MSGTVYIGIGAVLLVILSGVLAGIECFCQHKKRQILQELKRIHTGAEGDGV